MNDDVINVALVNSIPNQPQVQCSTHDQLVALSSLAVKFGLYDANNLIQNLLERNDVVQLDRQAVREKPKKQKRSASAPGFLESTTERDF